MRILVSIYAFIMSLYCSNTMAMEEYGQDDPMVMVMDPSLFLTEPLFNSLSALKNYTYFPLSPDDQETLDDLLAYLFLYYPIINEINVGLILSQMPSDSQLGQDFLCALYQYKYKIENSNLDPVVIALRNRFIEQHLAKKDILPLVAPQETQKNLDKIDDINHAFQRFLKEKNLESYLFVISCDEKSLCLGHKTFNVPPLPEDFLKLLGELYLENLTINWEHIEDNKVFPLDELIRALVYPYQLKTVSLSNNNLSNIPPNISNLGGLAELNLSSNRLEGLPVDIQKLSNMKHLNLSGNYFKTMPAVLCSNIPNLRVLILSDNYIASLPKEIDGLSNLTNFDLSNNSLVILPESLDLLKNLRKFNLSKNHLTTLPEAIGYLTNLENLNVSSNELKEIPASIGRLQKLLKLDLSSNYLKHLPASIGNLRERLTTFNLCSNPIAQTGEHQEMWGEKELSKSYGDRVFILIKLPLSNFTPISKEKLYAELDKHSLRIDREKLKNTVLPVIPDLNMQPEEFMHHWEMLFSQLNFDNESDSQTYLSYDLLAGDFRVGDQERLPTNKDNIIYKLLPRLNGLVKALWEIPLSPGETEGWQMPGEYKPDMRKALAFIITSLLEKSPDTRAALFYQLINGLLYCPTGQKEGIDTVISSLMSTSSQPTTSFIEFLNRLIAAHKRHAFMFAITPGGLAQNTYVLALYSEKLKYELGFTSAFTDFRTEEPFFDPYYGSEANALQAFYRIINPDYLAQLLIDHSQNELDYQLADELAQLENNKANKERQNQIKARQKQISQVDRPCKIQDIASFLNQKGLLASKNDWKKYFSQNPLKIGNRAVLTKEGAIRVLFLSGFLTGALTGFDSHEEFSLLPFVTQDDCEHIHKKPKT